MLLKGILRRHVKPVSEEGFLGSQLPRRLIWSSFLGDGDSQGGRHPSWAFDMKTGKQTIKGKNLGGRQGVALSHPSCSGGIGLSQEAQGLYIFSVKTFCSTPSFLANTVTFSLSPWISASEESASFSLGYFFPSSTFAVFIALIVSLGPGVPSAGQLDSNTDTLLHHLKIIYQKQWASFFV